MHHFSVTFGYNFKCIAPYIRSVFSLWRSFGFHQNDCLPVHLMFLFEQSGMRYICAKGQKWHVGDMISGIQNSGAVSSKVEFCTVTITSYTTRRQ